MASRTLRQSRLHSGGPRHGRRFGVALLLIVGLLPRLSSSADWPQWGGSSHRNCLSSARQLPIDWDIKTGRNIAWTTKLGSSSLGGTVVAGDHIYVGTNNTQGFVERYPPTVDLGCLVCLDRETGEFIWQHSSEKLAIGRQQDWPMLGIISTPCVDGDRLWYVNNRAEVVCLDTDGFLDGANDGSFQREPSAANDEADVVWQFDMRAILGVSPHNASVCSPTTDGERLFIITGNGVDESHVRIPAPQAPDFLCLDRDTGAILWTDCPVGERLLHTSWSSPAYAVIRGVPMVLMGGGDGWLYAYDPAGDGAGGARLLWKFDCNPKSSKWQIGGRPDHCQRNDYIATPVVVNDRIYVRTGQDPEHGGGPAELWCIDPFANHLPEQPWSGADLSATLVYSAMDNGQPVGVPLPPRRMQNLDVAAGEVEVPNPQSAVIWRFSGQDINGQDGIEFDESMHRGLSSPTIAEGLLFIADGEGILLCLEADTGRLLWNHDLLANSYSTPLVADGRLYMTDEDGDVLVLAVAPEKRVLAEFEIGSSINCTAVACGETLYLLDRDRLHAIRATDTAGCP
ncbi:MAG: PQQ-binding-like beta-propeller repeat protein [Planctomycetaceae bacterium]